MGELGLNKIMGAVLATALGLFALNVLSGIVFSSGGGHHGDDHAENMTMTEKFCSKFAYCVEIAETGAGAAVAEVFDLGLALTNADVEKGAKSFKGKCATCHTVNQGGVNGTGPNLYNTVGAPFAGHAGFAYSNALSSMGGNWTYEELDHWLEAPSKMVSGTSMSFAGVPRDDERANIIAYLASNTDNAPAFPAPLEVADDTDATEDDAGEAGEDTAAPADATETDADAAPSDEAPAPEAPAPDASEATEGAAPTEGSDLQEDAAVTPASATDTVEEVTEAVTEAADDATTAVTDAAGDVTEVVEEVVEDVTDAATSGMEAPDQRAFDHAAGTDVKDPEVVEGEQ